VLTWAALLSHTALAQTTFTTQSVNMRSGPDRAFPLVTWLPHRTQGADEDVLNQGDGRRRRLRVKPRRKRASDQKG